ncbi:hypothetical protein Lesp02_03910 [Lentzea sp. NBRC 105346]|uniref:helix-turn-helix domain-containing protein n=1 Tax=Lentzea sp. NBRC 105346 TaxID=3032205 RepID=UPI0024A20187|nr:hypothetical protein Lesp02_03910 [Lentzea sp. NBRC 105346]
MLAGRAVMMDRRRGHVASARAVPRRVHVEEPAPPAADSVVARTWRILEIVSGSPDGVGLTEIAHQADLPSSTAHRLLHQLQEQDVLHQNRRRLWTMGPKWIQVVSQSANHQPDAANLSPSQ